MKIPPGARELMYLRELAALSRKEHAARLGHRGESTLRKIENGDKTASRSYLAAAVEHIGHSPEAVDALLALHPVLRHLPPAEPLSPLALDPDELERIDRACLGAVAGLLECLRPLMIREKKRRKAEEARQEADALWPDLRTAGWKERRQLVETWPTYRTWAMAERVCEASIKAAADRADRALELAVFDGSDEAFAQAWKRWPAGSDSEWFPEWRLLDLEASLRRAQHRWPEALERLDLARKRSAGDKRAPGLILLNRANVFHQMGESQKALDVLEEAMPMVEISGDPHLLFALRFNTADNLARLERWEEAARLMPEVDRLAAEQAKGLDSLRVTWLGAKVKGGTGRKEEAMADLERVQDAFAAEELPYDAALAGLDLSVLWLKDGRTAEVRKLAEEMTWLFVSKKIHREALASLAVFCEAAKQEAATVELARQVIGEVEKARRSGPAMGN